MFYQCAKDWYSLINLLPNEFKVITREINFIRVFFKKKSKTTAISVSNIHLLVSENGYQFWEFLDKIAA